MPPNPKVSREDILRAALELVRGEGAGALNARAVARALGCSTQPVFRNFATMEELRQAVLQRGEDLYHQYLQTDMARGEEPPYKASGLAYIRFAREEPELFKLLFMRDRRGEEIREDAGVMETMTALIARQTGLSREEAYLFHLEMWVSVHGIAAMIATGYLAWDPQVISRMLTDLYQGLRLGWRTKRGGEG